ncbi:MAG TPA: hypothetical protein VNZ86_07125 [Bacteroidia bacterium]|nr:hypothetical protein [Bacteroidia bacterium]
MTRTSYRIMDKELINHLIWTLGLLILGGILTRGYTRKVKPDAEGMKSLRMNPIHLIFGLAFLGFGILPVLIPLINTGKIAEFAEGWGILLFALISCIGVFFILVYRNFRMSYDEKTITTRDFFLHIATVNWDTIKEVTFRPATGMLTIEDNYGEKAKVHQHLEGFPEFVRMMGRKTAWNATKLKIPDQVMYGKRKRSL